MSQHPNDDAMMSASTNKLFNAFTTPQYALTRPKHTVPVLPTPAAPQLGWRVRDPAAKVLLKSVVDSPEEMGPWKDFLNRIVSVPAEDASVWYERAIKTLPHRSLRKDREYLLICLKWATLNDHDDYEVKSRLKWITTNGIGKTHAELYLKSAELEARLGNTEKAGKILKNGIKKRVSNYKILVDALEGIQTSSQTQDSESDKSFNNTANSMTIGLSQPDTTTTAATAAAPSTWRKTDFKTPSTTAAAPSKSSEKGSRRGLSSQLEERPSICINNSVFFILELIGKGAYGKVFKVIGEDYKIYALKKVKVDPSEPKNMENLANELELLCKLRGKDHIIQMYDYEERYSAGLVLMLFELGEVDLTRYVQANSPLSINVIKTFWEQMLEAVQCIHEARIVHGDLKPSNFLLVSGSLKLIDFGIAKAISNDTMHIQRDGQIGTVHYMSPEAIRASGDSDTMRLGRESDIWSLGCILYQLVYGKTPFHDINNIVSKFLAISDPLYPIEYPAYDLDPRVLDVLRRCLKRDPASRPTIPELLSHPFLTDTGGNKDAMHSLFSQLKKAGLLDGRVDQDKLGHELAKVERGENVDFRNLFK